MFFKAVLEEVVPINRLFFDGDFEFFQFSDG